MSMYWSSGTPAPLLLRRWLRERAGQSVVELAITLPILLLLMLGLVNLGLLMHAQIVLTNAAWEGARAGATITDPVHGDEEIVGAVQRSLSGLDASRVTIDIDP